MSRRLLAIDTATTACSVALFDDGLLIASDFAEIGRGHAERLVPTIAALANRGRADDILVNCGPGSFTGVRIGISAGRALALAWSASVSGYSTMALVAAQAQQQLADRQAVCIAMHAGHGEYFVQNFSAAGEPLDSLASLPPEQAARQVGAEAIAGSAASELAGICGAGIALTILPDAACTNLLDDSMKQLPVDPIYGRKPDAQPVKAA